jgi:hypothetical protein
LSYDSLEKVGPNIERMFERSPGAEWLSLNCLDTCACFGVTSLKQSPDLPEIMPSGRGRLSAKS